MSSPPLLSSVGYHILSPNRCNRSCGRSPYGKLPKALNSTAAVSVYHPRSILADMPDTRDILVTCYKNVARVVLRIP